MTTFSVTKKIEGLILPSLERIPWLSVYIKNRGWPYVLAWGHRASGILLVLYAWFHIYTLSLLQTPNVFDSKMNFLKFFLFVFLEWLLSIPVIFHALNGGRLILYESFGNRKDTSAIRWVITLSVVYLLLVGFMMILANQIVSPVFFWLCTLICALCFGCIVFARTWKTQNRLTWKLQRISGGFLIIMIPAHFLFMHLQPSIGHEASVIVTRMQHLFIKIVDLLLVVAVLYHSGYGLLSAARDYLSSRAAYLILTLLVCLVMVLFAWIGIQLTIAI